MNNLVDKFYNKDSIYKSGIDTAADDTLSPILDYGNTSAHNHFDNRGNGSTVAAEPSNVDGGLGAVNRISISDNGLTSADDSSNINLNLNIGNNSANGNITISSSDDFVAIIVGLGDLINTLRSVSFEYKAPSFRNNNVQSINNNNNTNINNGTNNSSSASLRPETKRSNSTVSYLSASSNGESLLAHDLLIGSEKTIAHKIEDNLMLDGKSNNNKQQQIFSRNYGDFVKTKERYKGLSYNSDFSFASPKNNNNYHNNDNRSPDSDESNIELSKLNDQLKQLVECVRYNDKQISAYYNMFSNFKQKLFFCNQRLVAFKKALVNKIQYLNACANECSNTTKRNQTQNQNQNQNQTRDQNQDREPGEADFKSYLVEIGKLEQHLGDLKGTIEQNNRLIEEIDRRLEEDEKMRSLIRRNQVRRNRAIAKGAAYVVVAVCVAFLANVVLKHAIRTRIFGTLTVTLP